MGGQDLKDCYKITFTNCFKPFLAVVKKMNNSISLTKKKYFTNKLMKCEIFIYIYKHTYIHTYIYIYIYIYTYIPIYVLN